MPHRLTPLFVPLSLTQSHSLTRITIMSTPLTHDRGFVRWNKLNNTGSRFLVGIELPKCKGFKFNLNYISSNKSELCQTMGTFMYDAYQRARPFGNLCSEESRGTSVNKQVQLPEVCSAIVCTGNGEVVVSGDNMKYVDKYKTSSGDLSVIVSVEGERHVLYSFQGKLWLSGYARFQQPLVTKAGKKEQEEEDDFIVVLPLRPRKKGKKPIKKKGSRKSPRTKRAHVSLESGTSAGKDPQSSVGPASKASKTKTTLLSEQNKTPAKKRRRTTKDTENPIPTSITRTELKAAKALCFLSERPAWGSVTTTRRISPLQ